MRAIVSALPLLIVIVPSALFAEVHELPTAANMKVLGLVGGTSWHSTVEYHRYINQEVNDLYGSNTNPPLVLYNLNQNEIHDSTHSPSATLASPGRMPPLLGGIAYAPRPRGSFVRW
jgi:hypothetical protein